MSSRSGGVAKWRLSDGDAWDPRRYPHAYPHAKIRSPQRMSTDTKKPLLFSGLYPSMDPTGTQWKMAGGADGIVAAQYVDEKTPVFAGLIVAFPLKSPQERAALGGPPRNSSPDGFGM